MKITAQKNSLSESDMDLLAGSMLIQTMMKNRLLIKLDSQEYAKFETHLDDLELDQCRGFYHIKDHWSTGNDRVVQIWFELDVDCEHCYNKLIEFKMSHS